MNKPLTIAMLLTLSVSLGGCFTLGGKPDMISTFKPIEVPAVQPTPMNLNDVQWQVYTVAELRAMVDQMEAQGQQNAVFYVLPKDQYERLAMNLAEMKRFISDQKATNEYLLEAIDINNKNLAQAQEQANQ